jgi:hypothetical protein
MLSTMHTAPRILYMRAFTHLFMGKPSGLNVRNIVCQSTRFCGLLADINATLAHDYAAATEYVTVFEAVRMIHEHRLTWDREAYTESVGNNARLVRQDLRKFRGWKAELDKMKVSQVRAHHFAHFTSSPQRLLVSQNRVSGMRARNRQTAPHSCVPLALTYTTRIPNTRMDSRRDC